MPVGSWERVVASNLGKDAARFKDVEEAKSKEEKTRLFENMKERRNEISNNTGMLQVGVLKAMIDGSLGTHTGAFLDDYDDTPGYKGAFIWDR